MVTEQPFAWDRTTKVPGIWDRLVVVFPMNGELDEYAIRIYLRESSHMDIEVPRPYIVVTGNNETETAHATIEGALKIALNNGGWGSYRIEEVTYP